MQLDDVKIERSTTVDRIVIALKKAMFDGKILPGEQLKELVLSQTFSVSRSTVREALRIMTSEGLAVHSPNKGVTVRQLTVEEIKDIFLTRSVLEISAARAVRKCSPGALQALEAAMQQYAAAAATGDALAAADSHVDFHSALVGLIGSKRLMETERTLMLDLKLVIASIDKSRDDLGREVKKHENLTRLLITKDETGAIEFIKNDLCVAKGFIIKHIDN
ncbi:GntR family transcriptional regulator [Desulforhopalus singaporensis]|uniref:DNA-binding transcriptional regulator, GntR family n=1 Tax=Desulforhopalus singaporensis TaxID=91360 RepID=A0A1H0RXA0_9BACT|nr:GntR family transcriptional regulator [Desulforhopalus singaporensis]SDP34094.1 DNA-binding transcriptional regulator, GntR family [Desulforhopalus singaporensis]